MSGNDVLAEFTERWDGIEVLSTKRMADEIVRLREQLAASEPVACPRLGACFSHDCTCHPSAAGVSEPVSTAYTLPATVRSIIDAAVAYEQWQGKWYNYTVASGEKPAKQQRALIEAVRKHRAALTAASEGASA